MCSIRPAKDHGFHAWVWVVACGWALYSLLFYDLFDNEIEEDFADLVTLIDCYPIECIDSRSCQQEIQTARAN